MNLLALLAKHWQPGMVKTRLAGTIGTDLAARIHHLFVQATVLRFRNTGDSRVLAYWPHEARQDFRTISGSEWDLHVQSDGDLGQRLSHLLSDYLQPPVRTVLFLGSDSPDLPATFVDQAFEALKRIPIVIGPATDGGYYLIGMSTPATSIFENIDWGSQHVLAQTIQRIRDCGLSFELLPSWEDVDDEPALNRLKSRLHRLSDQNDADLRQLLATLESLDSSTTIEQAAP